ncbi:recognition of host receptor [Escherichia phage pEC-N1203-2Af.1]|nr:recognition of host receptor [Escherichia phage pEC-N1203-2Af.1]
MSGFLRCCKYICECIYSNGHVLLSGLPRLRLGLFYIYCIGIFYEKPIRADKYRSCRGQHAFIEVQTGHHSYEANS